MDDRDKTGFLRWVIAGGVLIALFSNMGDLGLAYALPVTLVLIIALALALRGPLGKAIARHLEGDAPAGPDPALYEELDALRARVGELEERVDFTERLLAQHREHDQLGAR